MHASRVLCGAVRSCAVGAGVGTVVHPAPAGRLARTRQQPPRTHTPTPRVALVECRHVELEGGIEFPFSRGVSFYEINEQGKIVFARDIVEPAMKPGGAALKVGCVWVFRWGWKGG